MVTSPSSASLYDVLGVPPSATGEEIRKAYLRQAKVRHPDLTAAGDGSSGSSTSSDFVQLKHAFDVLSDDERRAAYDRGSCTLPKMQLDPDAVDRRAAKFQATVLRHAQESAKRAASMPPPPQDLVSRLVPYVRRLTKPSFGMLVPLFVLTTYYLAHGGPQDGATYRQSKI